MASSHDVGKKISQLHQELVVNTYKKKFQKNSFFIGKWGVFVLSGT